MRQLLSLMKCPSLVCENCNVVLRCYEMQTNSALLIWEGPMIYAGTAVLAGQSNGESVIHTLKKESVNQFANPVKRKYKRR